MKPAPPTVRILLPVHEADEGLEMCLRSLASHLPKHSSLWVLHFGPPGNLVPAACDAFDESGLNPHYTRVEQNLPELWDPGTDLLLLRPQARVTAGFLEEMRTVLYLHERHAIVAPRTNGPSLLSFAPQMDQPPAESYRLWEKFHASLPRYHIVPAISKTCILIKGEVLARFGLFDLAALLDAENDFVRRINRYGYSTLAANWAYVFDAEPASDPLVSLTAQYPELDRKISDYHNVQIDPVETFAILHSPHRPRILYDLYHLPPQHSGTSDFALNLLRELEPLARQEYDLYVGAGDDQSFFLTDLCGYRLHNPKTSLPMLFDLVYKPCQIFRWHEFARMTRLAPRIAFTLQDSIALRCDYIGNSSLPPIFQKTVELSDLVFTISESSRSDFAAYYSIDSRMRVIYHGSNSRLLAQETTPGDHILIMGNALTHKGVAEAVHCLADDFPLAVVGLEAQSDSTNVRWLTSGQLSRRVIHQLFRDARIVVYPSYYEGYGLPVADALAMGKPVIVLDTAVNREIASLTGDPNLHRIFSLSQLNRLVRRLWDEPPILSNAHPRTWPDAAAEYLAAFRALLSQDVDVPKMRRRWETVRLIESLGSN